MGSVILSDFDGWLCDWRHTPITFICLYVQYIVVYGWIFCHLCFHFSVDWIIRNSSHVLTSFIQKHTNISSYFFCKVFNHTYINTLVPFHRIWVSLCNWFRLKLCYTFTAKADHNAPSGQSYANTKFGKHGAWKIPTSDSDDDWKLTESKFQTKRETFAAARQNRYRMKWIYWENRQEAHTNSTQHSTQVNSVSV